MNNIIKKKEISEFVALSENRIIGFHEIGNEIVFPFTRKQLIEINSHCKISFFDGINEKKFRLTKADFEANNQDVNILYEIGAQFNLEKILHRRDYFSYQFETKVPYDDYLINFKKCKENIFCILYSVRKEREAQSMAEDMFSGNVLYIYGIWEVELSEEFKKSLNMEK
jgi:hypothetical protein